MEGGRPCDNLDFLVAKLTLDSRDKDGTDVKIDVGSHFEVGLTIECPIS